jgi:hypothetical protein
MSASEASCRRRCICAKPGALALAIEQQAAATRTISASDVFSANIDVCKRFKTLRVVVGASLALTDIR